MGKKQDRIAQQMLDAYLAALAQARQPGAAETELFNQAMGTINWAKGGDYRQPPKGIFFNFADPAARKRQRELIMGAGARGTAALGTPNATALALDKANRDDEFDVDQAANYQEQVSNAVGNAAGSLGNAAGMENARRMGILGSTQGMAAQGLQYQLRDKPSWWRTFSQSFANSLGNTLGGPSLSFGG